MSALWRICGFSLTGPCRMCVAAITAGSSRDQADQLVAHGNFRRTKTGRVVEILPVPPLEGPPHKRARHHHECDADAAVEYKKPIWRYKLVREICYTAVYRNTLMRAAHELYHFKQNSRRVNLHGKPDLFQMQLGLSAWHSGPPAGAGPACYPRVAPLRSPNTYLDVAASLLRKLGRKKCGLPPRGMGGGGLPSLRDLENLYDAQWPAPPSPRFTEPPTPSTTATGTPPGALQRLATNLAARALGMCPADVEVDPAVVESCREFCAPARRALTGEFLLVSAGLVTTSQMATSYDFVACVD